LSRFFVVEVVFGVVAVAAKLHFAVGRRPSVCTFDHLFGCQGCVWTLFALLCTRLSTHFSALSLSTPSKWKTTPQHQKEITRRVPEVPQALQILTRKARITKSIMKTVAFWHGNIFLVFLLCLPLVCFLLPILSKKLKKCFLDKMFCFKYQL